MTSPPPAELPSLFPELEREEGGGPRHGTGTLPSQDIERLIEGGVIRSDRPIADDQVQPASLDLRLGPVAHRIQASFLPGPASTVESKLRRVVVSEIDLTRPALLERGCVYLIPLAEEVRLPRRMRAKASPRSTIGRLDVFTRLIADYGREFDRVPAGYKGKLWVEVMPSTFSVFVRKGLRLNQLRFVIGRPLPADKHISELGDEEPIVYSDDGEPETPRVSKGLRISVGLRPRDDSGIIGYRAKAVTPAIDLTNPDPYDPLDFWDPIRRTRDGSVVLTADHFYIFGSKERVRVPPEAAAELVPYDPAMGEFRIHYAGFFDPGFGYGTGDIKGATAVLEVRSHKVPFVIEDGQEVGRLLYERLLARPTKLYGDEAGSSYQAQGLLLSRYFRRIGEG